MKYIQVLLIILFISSCADKKVDLSEIEQYYLELYNAEDVNVTWNKTANTTYAADGVNVKNRKYYLVEIINSDSLNNSFNDRSVFDLETRKIAEILANNLDSTEDQNEWEIQVDVISELDLWIYSNSNKMSIVYHQPKVESE